MQGASFFDVLWSYGGTKLPPIAKSVLDEDFTCHAHTVNLPQLPTQSPYPVLVKSPLAHPATQGLYWLHAAPFCGGIEKPPEVSYLLGVARPLMRGGVPALYPPGPGTRWGFMASRLQGLLL